MLLLSLGLGLDGINGLILGAPGYIFRCEIGQKTFRLLFTRQMRWKPFDVVAISLQPGARTRFCGERKMLASNDFSKWARRIVLIRSAILIHEPAVVY
jgi:hypothetical protein